MARRQSILIACAVSSCFAVSLVFADEPKLDRYGDALPAGAVLRLGTTRLRHSDGVGSVAWTPDGQLLATGGRDAAVRLWDIASGRQVAEFRDPAGVGRGPMDEWNAVVFSPNGSQIAAAGGQGVVCVWNLSDQSLVWRHANVSNARPGAFVAGQGFSSVAFSPDGKVIAATGEAPFIKILDAASGDSLRKIDSPGRNELFRPVVFSPDGRFLASTADKAIHVWDATTRQQVFVVQQAHQQEVVSLAFTNDSRQLISGGSRFERGGPRDGRLVSEIALWDVPSGNAVAKFIGQDLEGSPDIFLSADGRQLYSAHRDGIVIWDFASRMPVRSIRTESAQLSERAHGLAASRDGRFLATRGHWRQRNKAWLWDLTEDREVFAGEDAHASNVLAVRYSPDGALIATGGSDNTVRFWNAVTGEHLQLVDEGSGWVRLLEFSPDGKQLFIGRETHTPGEMAFRGEIKSYRVGDGKLLTHVQAPDRLMCGALSNDGQFLAAALGLGEEMDPFGGGDDAPPERIIVWDAATGDEISNFVRGPRQPISMTFSPDDAQLFVAVQTGPPQCWDWRKRDSLPATIDMQDFGERHYAKTAFDAANGRVAVGALTRGADRRSAGRLAMKDLSGGPDLWQHDFAETRPWEVAISPEGTLLAVFCEMLSQSTAESALEVYRAKDGEKLASFPLADRRIASIAFSPDASRIVTGMDLGDALVWDVSDIPK